MRLSKGVLDVMRGASGAAMALAIGCSSSHATPIRGEPAARLSPVVIAMPAARAVTAPVVVTPPPIATLEPVPAATPPPVPDTPDAGARHRRHRRPNGIGNIGTPPGYDVAMANCGRG